MTTAIERLESECNRLEAEASALRAKLSEHESTEAWRWTRHQRHDSDGGLPVPRLELRWEPIDERGYNWRALYSLVHRHFLGHYVTVPMGETRVGGMREPLRDGEVDLPFRDGVHIKHDMRELNVPGFAIYGDHVTKLDPLAQVAPYESGGAQ
jgi:hypothetical protein